MSQFDTLCGCPNCGSTKGYEAQQKLTQSYDAHGEPDGYSLNDAPVLTVCCRNCGKKFKLKQIKNLNDRKG